MKTRTGKIARLPKPIRDQLNQRLDNGELATTLVEWLNQQPDVQRIITEQFAGLPIRPQNLSEWRKGGYLEWTRHQLLREQTRWTAEQATDLESDTDERTMSIAEDIALIMSAELALQVQALGEITDPKKRFEKFLILAKELSRLRRDDQRAVRINHRREHWEYDHPKKYSPPATEPEKRTDQPYAGGASPSARTVLASRLETDPKLDTQNAKPETSNQPTAAGASNLTSPPDCGLKTADCRPSATSSFCILPSAFFSPPLIQSARRPAQAIRWNFSRSRLPRVGLIISTCPIRPAR